MLACGLVHHQNNNQFSLQDYYKLRIIRYSSEIIVRFSEKLWRHMRNTMFHEIFAGVFKFRGLQISGVLKVVGTAGSEFSRISGKFHVLYF